MREREDRGTTVKRGATGRIAAERTGAGWSAGARMTGPMVTRLQASAGNRTVSRLLAGPAVQRDLGWSGPKTQNSAAEPKADGTDMARIPLEDLKRQNQAEAPDKAKTTESAAGRAVVWIHPELDPSRPVTVLLHLHGLTNRAGDPFAGYRENNVESEERLRKQDRAGVRSCFRSLSSDSTLFSR